MNLLPHWVLTDKFPAFYDSESKTAIEQTARIYGAMQELITEYNSFVDSVNQHILDFENAAKKDYEIFTTAIRQEFQDFIDVVTLKIQSQDSIIEDAVSYMKTNLSESIDAALLEMRASGGFSQEVLKVYADIENQIAALNSRMNTFTALEEGSTTGDAELQDARTDYTGKTWDNVGEHIRGVTSELSSDIDDLETLVIGGNSYFPFTLEQGGWGDEDNVVKKNNAEYTLQVRIRTAEPKSLKNKLTIQAKDGYKFAIYEVENDGYTLYRHISWQTEYTITPQNGKKYVITFAENNNAEVFVANFNDYVSFEYENTIIPMKNPILDNTDWNSLLESGVYPIFSAANGDNMPPLNSDSPSGILKVYASNGVIYQEFNHYITASVFMRYYTRTGNWKEWKRNNDNNDNEISILFVGNSLTQDGIAYLPYILKTYYPDIKFRIYMWYIGGVSLAEHYDYFVNDTNCAIFSVAENTATWTNYNSSITMSSILNTYKFDIVCMQEYFNYKESYTDLTDWNNCQDYIQSHYAGGNGLKFVTLLHAPKRDNAEAIFNLTKNGVGLILRDTIAEDLIANGISVYRALSTDLDSLGDSGHLSNDGTHTQEGLPCLVQTYVTLLWLFDKLGINKSIYGCPLRMTNEIYQSINVPGANLGSGVIVGTTEQNLLAQKIAILAYKEGKKLLNDNLS